MDYFFFRGKVAFAHTSKPDKFGKYSLSLLMDGDDIPKFNSSGIQKAIKGTDEGPMITFGRPVNRVNKEGQIIEFGAVKVLDKNGDETDLFVERGDDIVVKVGVYQTIKGPGSILESCMLLNKEGQYADREKFADPSYTGPRF